MKIILKSDQFNLKKPQHLENNVYVLYSPKTVIVETANSRIIDTNIILKLYLTAKAFVATRFRGQDIQEIDKQKQRLWITLLNESCFERLTVNKDAPLGFLVIKPEDLKVKYEAKKGQKSRKVYLKTGTRNGKTTGEKRKRPQQREDFLNRYNFVYAGRDTVNQLGR